MTTDTIEHATFTLERTYPASVRKTFHAWADAATKARWFAGGATADYSMDFRPGGIERNRAIVNGKEITWESHYRDIVPDARIVYTSVLSENGILATVSLTTVEFSAEGDKTTLVLTETGAYLDGRERPEWREQGTGDWLDSLGQHLADRSAA